MMDEILLSDFLDGFPEPMCVFSPSVAEARGFAASVVHANAGFNKDVIDFFSYTSIATGYATQAPAAGAARPGFTEYASCIASAETGMRRMLRWTMVSVRGDTHRVLTGVTLHDNLGSEREQGANTPGSPSTLTAQWSFVVPRPRDAAVNSTRSIAEQAVSKLQDTTGQKFIGGQSTAAAAGSSSSSLRGLPPPAVTDDLRLSSPKMPLASSSLSTSSARNLPQPQLLSDSALLESLNFRADCERHLSHVDWSAHPLGPIDGWPETLQKMVGMAFHSPFPVLLAWGPHGYMLYNEAYAEVIGSKHPHIMGMHYKDAWIEVWDVVKEPVTAALEGRSTHSSFTQMFMERSALLEETYFTWSMIPIQGLMGGVEGIYIPNFDHTSQVIQERRMRTLREVNGQLSAQNNMEALCKSALTAIACNALDLPFALIYNCTNAAADEDAYSMFSSSNNASHCSSSMNGAAGNARTTGSYVFSLSEQVSGFRAGAAAQLPQSIISVSSAAAEMEASTDAAGAAESGLGHREDVSMAANSGSPAGGSNSIEHFVRLAHQTGRPVQVTAECIDGFHDLLVPNVWGDRFQRAVALPIISGHDESIYAVALIGLNTRREYDADYAGFLDLIVRAIGNGMTGVTLYQEEMRRAKYLTEMNKLKNQELQEMLQSRTRELRNTELQFMQITEQSPAGILLGDLQGNITYVNEAWYAMSGHPRAVHASTWVTTSVHEEDAARVEALWLRCREQRTVFEFRFRALAGDEPDRVRWVEARLGPLLDDQGNAHLISGVFVDISRRKVEEALQAKRTEDAIETKRQQEYFIDMTSHELRNPLSAICLAVDAVVDRLDEFRASPEEMRRIGVSDLTEAINDVSIITLCTMHMRRLIDDVLSLSKLESDLLLITPVSCQPLAFVRDIIKMFAVELSAKRISLDLVVQDGYRAHSIDWVQVDPSRITQVLINLLTNAIKFTSEAPVRRISISIDACMERPVLAGNSPIGSPLLHGAQHWRPSGQDSRGDGGSRRSEEAAAVADTDSDPAESSTAYLSARLAAISTDRHERHAPRRDKRVFLIFTVTDTGQGLEESERVLLFQRFKQAKPRTHVQYGGSGLGLFICRKLAQLLGGEISVTSQAGKGSSFTFFVEADRSALPASEFTVTPEDREFAAAECVATTAAIAANSKNREIEELISTSLNGSPRSSPDSTKSPRGHLRSQSAQATEGASKRTKKSLSALVEPWSGTTGAAGHHNIASPVAAGFASLLPPVMPTQSAPAEARLNVLLTEDNLINQKLLQRQLVKAGCAVTLANNGQEALNVIMRSNFARDSEDAVLLDCVLLDIEMPVMDGITCIGKIREREANGALVRHIPVIAVTANARHEQMEAIKAAGMDDAVAKPFQIAELLRKMHELIQRIEDNK